MCIGVPAKVIEKYEYTATVDVMGTKMNVGTILLDQVQVGDFVIVHAGQAMTVIDEEFAKQSLEEWRKIADAELD
ncbi:MAG TPA: HypC/HybG/HupF family hydrogenase formation chaperone [Bacillota bacterium]|nr:HypC/HybG/HupF family hydrogenase formation chaperone [Bacillota bacterium]